MKRIAWIFILIFIASCSDVLDINENIITAEQIEIRKIYGSEGGYFAFTDIAEFRNKFYITFRESDEHVYGEDGMILILESCDTENWKLSKRIKVEGLDLRDPKFAINDNILLLYIHGAKYLNRELISTEDFVTSLHEDGNWSILQDVKVGNSGTIGNEAWPWRPVWHDGNAYTFAYNGRKEIFDTYKSQDGIVFLKMNVCNLDYSNKPCEGTIRVDEQGRFYAIIRQVEGNALIGFAENSDLNWIWCDTIPIINFGGPNFLLLPEELLLSSGRGYEDGESKTVLLYSDLNKHKTTMLMTLPSSGDCSYPGMLLRGDTLLLSYYSTHMDELTSIYLAKILLHYN